MRDKSKALTVVNTQKRTASSSSSNTTVIYGSGGVSSGVSGMQGGYLPAKRGEDGVYIVDVNLVRFTGSVVSEKEISAYQAAEEGSEEHGAITIYDALDSEAVDVALSANQGRILKLMIEEKLENFKNNLTGLEDVVITAPADGQVLTYNSETKKWINGEVKKVTWENIEGKPADLTEENIEKWNNKLDKAVWDSAFYFDDSGNLRAIVNVIGEKEVSAYGAGASSGTGSITIVDALTSDATDCALSANMGRILKQLIDSKESISDWSDIKNKPTTLAGFGITDGTKLSDFNLHKNDTDIHITADERSSWNNKLDKAVWDSAFYFDDTGNIRVKLNLIGEKEVSAYGAGASSTGAITIIDALTSEATDAALSANQGRVLKQLIDAKSSISSWDDITDKPGWIGNTKPSYTWSEILSKPDTFTPSEHTHGYVSTVKVGETSYNVLSNTVSLPAYPTLSSIGAAASSDLTSHTGNTTIHITSTERSNWNTAYNNYHSHSNKSVLDGISSTNISNWNTAYNNYHSHSNKSVLDGITSTKVSNWDTVYTNWGKAFYFDSNGNLKVKLNLIGEKEVSAYDSGSSSSGGVTIIDALTSTSTDAALSANQGRVLKQLIDEITASGSGSGSTVSFTRSLSSGTQIGTITINGTSTTIYAPTQYATTASANYSSGVKLGYVNVNGTTTNFYAPISVSQSLTSGTKIGSITIAGTTTSLYAPSGSGGGSTVSFTRSLTAGTKIGSITIDGTSTDIYAPTQYATSPKANYSSGINLGYINVNGTSTYFYAPVSVSQTLSSGTEIGSVTIAGTTTKLYAPSGGSGTSVSFTQTLTSGTEIGKITIDGTATTLYAPSGGSTTTGDYLPLAGGTLTGNLRLKKNTSNYGMYLYFGDGSYCYLNEDTDDHLTIYASKGINLKTSSGYSVQVNGTDISSGSGGDYLPLAGGAMTGGFRFNYWSGSGTIPSSANVVVATGNVTLPSASTVGAGHVIFIHHKGGNITVSGSIYDSAGNSGAVTSVTMDGAHMAVSDGSYWRWFWCK